MGGKWHNGGKVARLSLAFWRNPAPFDVAHGPGRNGHGRGSIVVPSPVVVVAEKERSDDVMGGRIWLSGRERNRERERKIKTKKNYKILYIISVIINLY